MSSYDDHYYGEDKDDPKHLRRDSSNQSTADETVASSYDKNTTSSLPENDISPPVNKPVDDAIPPSISPEVEMKFEGQKHALDLSDVDNNDNSLKRTTSDNWGKGQTPSLNAEDISETLMNNDASCDNLPSMSVTSENESITSHLSKNIDTIRQSVYGSSHNKSSIRSDSGDSSFNSDDGGDLMWGGATVPRAKKGDNTPLGAIESKNKDDRSPDLSNTHQQQNHPTTISMDDSDDSDSGDLMWGGLTVKEHTNNNNRGPEPINAHPEQDHPPIIGMNNGSSDTKEFSSKLEDKVNETSQESSHAMTKFFRNRTAQLSHRINLPNKGIRNFSRGPRGSSKVEDKVNETSQERSHVMTKLETINSHRSLLSHIIPLHNKGILNSSLGSKNSSKLEEKAIEASEESFHVMDKLDNIKSNTSLLSHIFPLHNKGISNSSLGSKNSSKLEEKAIETSQESSYVMDKLDNIKSNTSLLSHVVPLPKKDISNFSLGSRSSSKLEERAIETSQESSHVMDKLEKMKSNTSLLSHIVSLPKKDISNSSLGSRSSSKVEENASKTPQKCFPVKLETTKSNKSLQDHIIPHPTKDIDILTSSRGSRSSSKAEDKVNETSQESSHVMTRLETIKSHTSLLSHIIPHPKKGIRKSSLGSRSSSKLEGKVSEASQESPPVMAKLEKMKSNTSLSSHIIPLPRKDISNSSRGSMSSSKLEEKVSESSHKSFPAKLETIASNKSLRDHIIPLPKKDIDILTSSRGSRSLQWIHETGKMRDVTIGVDSVVSDEDEESLTDTDKEDVEAHQRSLFRRKSTIMENSDLDESTHHRASDTVTMTQDEAGTEDEYDPFAVMFMSSSEEEDSQHGSELSFVDDMEEANGLFEGWGQKEKKCSVLQQKKEFIKRRNEMRKITLLEEMEESGADSKKPWKNIEIPPVEEVAKNDIVSDMSSTSSNSDESQDIETDVSLYAGEIITCNLPPFAKTRSGNPLLPKESEDALVALMIAKQCEDEDQSVNFGHICDLFGPQHFNDDDSDVSSKKTETTHDTTCPPGIDLSMSKLQERDSNRDNSMKPLLDKSLPNNGVQSDSHWSLFKKRISVSRRKSVDNDKEPSKSTVLSSKLSDSSLKSGDSGSGLKKTAEVQPEKIDKKSLNNNSRASSGVNYTDIETTKGAETVPQKTEKVNTPTLTPATPQKKEVDNEEGKRDVDDETLFYRHGGEEVRSDEISQLIDDGGTYAPRIINSKSSMHIIEEECDDQTSQTSRDDIVEELLDSFATKKKKRIKVTGLKSILDPCIWEYRWTLTTIFFICAITLSTMVLVYIMLKDENVKTISGSLAHNAFESAPPISTVSSPISKPSSAAAISLLSPSKSPTKFPTTPNLRPSNIPSFSTFPSSTAAPTKPPTPHYWDPLGTNIEGQDDDELFGSSVSMSADGNRIAIGARHGKLSGKKTSGYVKVFEFSSNTNEWVQLNATIMGKAEGDQAGFSVSLSGDGRRVAVGSRGFDGSAGVDTGQSAVYEYVARLGLWSEVGTGIHGLVSEDKEGWSLSLSNNGMRLATGAIYADGANGKDTGSIRIFQDVDQKWIQAGQTLLGSMPSDHFGTSVSLSGNGDRVAIGAFKNDDGGVDSGHIQIFEYTYSLQEWTLLGEPIPGSMPGEHFGTSVSLSTDGTRVSAGAPQNNVNGEASGQVRIYEYSIDESIIWKIVGSAISGIAREELGSSISLSENGRRLAVGAGRHTLSSSSVQVGALYVYEEMDGVWYLIGNEIYGTNSRDYLGQAVSISALGTRVGVGIIGADIVASNAGQVRVYEYSTT